MKAIVCMAAAFFATVSFNVSGADDPKQRQDLSAVIALQGKPCGEVVSYVAQGDNDFIATCKDGNKYRVYVKEGRVVVEKK